ncbi:MAG TPA: SLC13 family permease [Kiloniellales bacterium]|nr:SLC13 family permease [Kiloniellales bacterium]
MTADQILVFSILGGALILFAWGRLRYDLVAIIALLIAVLVGVVPADSSFSGFGHPAVVTVAAILIITATLRQSGVVEPVARLLRPLRRRQNLQILALVAAAAFCSAFMNNVGALALFLPIALQGAYHARRPPSEILMPVSFGTLLGGMTTLVGTPPNIIIATFRGDATGTSFGMFDFTPVGLAVALVGVCYVSLVGWRLLPPRDHPPEEAESMFQIEDYVTEVRLSEDSPYVGRRLVDLEALGEGDIAVVALIRRKERMLAPSSFLRLQAGDVLIFEAGAEALQHVVEEAKLDTLGAADMSAESLRSERVGVVEAVIAPGSRLEGRTARSLRLHTRYGVNLLGVARQGETSAERLGRVRFMAGDVLLLQGERESLPETLNALGCLPLAARGLALGRRKPSYLPAFLFGIGILLVVFRLVPTHIAFVGTATAMVLLRCLPLRELYESVDWTVVVLLGALIPVGAALETTGGTMVIADPILALQTYVPVWMLIALLMLVTMLLSDIMNNAATAVLMAPIGITIAEGLGANIDPFLMAVAIGASSTYLTPIGHQSNLLVMGPGGYRFGDYWRMGLALDGLIVLVATPMILLIWPL